MTELAVVAALHRARANGDDGNTSGVATDEGSVETEVLAAFHAYEAALIANDVDLLDEWFWDDARLVRFGLAEIQHGAAEVAAWRRASAGVPAGRRHERVTVTAFGPDMAIATLVFSNGGTPPLGRQSQVWIRANARWRIVHAHVSMMPATP